MVIYTLLTKKMTLGKYYYNLKKMQFKRSHNVLINVVIYVC